MMRSLKKMRMTTLTSEYDEGCYDAQILMTNAMSYSQHDDGRSVLKSSSKKKKS